MAKDYGDARPLFVVKRWPQTDDELWEWIATVWGVKIPRKAVCEGHVAPFTAFADAFFARKDPIVWKACVPITSAVLTRNGVYPAYFVSPGDEVLGWDEKTQTPQWGTVSKVRFSGIRPIVCLHTKYGRLRVTPNHRVLVRRNRTITWVEAGSVKPDQDQLILPLNFFLETGEPNTKLHQKGVSVGASLQSYSNTELDYPQYNFKDASDLESLDFLLGILLGIKASPQNAKETQWKTVSYAAYKLHFLRYLALGCGCLPSGVDGPIVSRYELSFSFPVKNSPKKKWLAAPVLFKTRESVEAVLDFTVDGVDSFCCDGFLVHNSRGFGGKSFLLATLGLTEAIILGANVTILGGSGAQSQNVHKYMQKFWTKPFAPKNLLKSDPTKMKTELRNGAEISALLASSTSVRGPHPARLRLDECDEMDVSILDAALGQPMDQNGIKAQTVLSSTHHYPDRTMTEILARAREKGWAVYEWCLGGGHTKIRCSSGWKDITEVTPEDEIMTRSGWAKVQHVTKTGVEPCLRVLLSNKKALVCTDSHKVLRFDGSWVEAKSLQPRDKLWGINEAGEHEEVTIESIHDLGLSLPVYDIGVHEAHELVAEGVVVHNCYRENMGEDGWLTREEIDRKKALVPEIMWQTEYELQEPSVEGRAFSAGKVEASFTPSLGEFSSDYIRIEEPQPNSTYITGVDWAKSQDYTIILTFKADDTPWVLVCAERMQRKPWPVLLEVVKNRIREYPGACVHDATGLGAVLDDYLDDLRSAGEVLTGRNRVGLFSDYVAAIESGNILGPRISWVYDDHRYCRVADLWGEGHPPDSVVAGALAWRGRSKGLSKAKVLLVHRKLSGNIVTTKYDKSEEGNIVSEKQEKKHIITPAPRTVRGSLNYLTNRKLPGRKFKKVRDPRYE